MITIIMLANSTIKSHNCHLSVVKIFKIYSATLIKISAKSSRQAQSAFFRKQRTLGCFPERYRGKSVSEGRHREWEGERERGRKREILIHSTIMPQRPPLDSGLLTLGMTRAEPSTRPCPRRLPFWNLFKINIIHYWFSIAYRRS